MSHKHAIPVFDHPLIETHCHLDYLDAETLDAVLQAASAARVERIITIAVSPDNQDKVMALVQRYPQVWGTQGLHPHEAEGYSNTVEAHIRANAAHERIVAIGEIGLDYYYDHADRGRQRTAFERQLQLASELDLPVVVHSREADADTQVILRNGVAGMSRRGVIHSFTAGRELAEYCLGEGFCLGFNGICTFKAADNVRDIIALTPLEQIVLETDAPYLTPVPYRGHKNEPKYLPFIARQVCGVKGIALETLLPQVWQNSTALFFGGQ